MINDEDKENREETKKQPTYTTWVCPHCGKTVHIGRKFCNCHTSLSRAKVRISKEQPEIGPCNFETSGLNCNDCPEDCKLCPSFGLPETNIKGFGGEGCTYRANTTRCSCCQFQVKLAIKIPIADFTKLVRKVVAKQGKQEDVFLTIADQVREELERFVLARINQEREMVG
jgi:hypothetical protein